MSYPARLLAIGFISLYAATGLSAEARARKIEPRFAKADALAERDRILVRAAGAGLCPGPQCPGDGAFEAALVPIGSGGDMLVIRFPSGGTCGAYEFAVFGPVGKDHRRLSDRDGNALLSECAERLSVEPNGRGLPDIVTGALIGRDTEQGPVAQDTTWRWTGDAYGAIRHARTAPEIEP